MTKDNAISQAMFLKNIERRNIDRALCASGGFATAPGLRAAGETRIRGIVGFIDAAASRDFPLCVSEGDRSRERAVEFDGRQFREWQYGIREVILRLERHLDAVREKHLLAGHRAGGVKLRAW